MRRLIVTLCFAIAGLFVVTCGAPVLHAGSYPEYPIQVIIPGAPGDALDMAARPVCEELAKILKAQVVPMNKPGAGGVLGTAAAIGAKKDGYTLLYGNTSGIVYGPAFNPKDAPYNPIRDLDPLGLHTFFPDGISVQTESPWKDFRTVVEYAKKNPGKFRVGTLGVGSRNHFLLEMIRTVTGAELAMIPFKGASPAMTAVLGGHIEAAFVAFGMVYPHYESGKLRGILADQKVAALPNIPVLTQLGYKQDLPGTYFGFAAPVGIPEEAKKVLIPAIEKAARNPELAEKLNKLWFIPNYKSPTEYKQMIARDYENACSIVKTMKID
jgi:tripartite-type tricarboxylate transporter receptor subunit TctC